MISRLIRHELGQSAKSLGIWTACIGFFIAICIFLFPSMKGEMGQVGDLFASMGAFTSAFGLDRLNFGTIIGFYATECGNIIGLGAALFAALAGVNALSREENGHTAEFLLTHPVGRAQVVASKLASLLIQIVALNIICTIIAAVSIECIGEPVEWKPLLLLNLSYLLVHIELGCICFMISSFCARNNPGIGLGLAIGMYFVNIVANISDEAKALKYITPFGFAEGADIVSEGALDLGLTAIGMSVAIVCAAISFVKYLNKDIR
ncbi:MAG: ABC transporter permease subunit [Candidatus Cryptobacteroides sp.]